MQKVVPAILTADPGQLQEQLGLLKDHAKWVQIDVMDGKFVPNVSVNLAKLGEAYQHFSLSVHLMVEEPEKYLEDCMAAGAQRVYFHWEATDKPQQVMAAMEKYSFQKGVALNPETQVSEVASLKGVEAVLLLSVVPGAQGHEFIPSVLDKVPQTKQVFPEALVGMDGGITEDTIKQAFRAGADYVAVGSSIWNSPDPLQTFKHLQEMIS